MANAGIDQSNVEQGAEDETALLLPENPDDTCVQLRKTLYALTGVEVAVIINDSHGRAFRNGTVGVAIGASGLSALVNLRGTPDLYRRQLRSTEVAFADEIASAASLLMGQAHEGRPIVLARGIPNARGPGQRPICCGRKRSTCFERPRRRCRIYSGAGVRSGAIRRCRCRTVSSNSCLTLRPRRRQRIIVSPGGLPSLRRPPPRSVSRG